MGDSMMATHSNLYVRNLPADIDQISIETMFQPYGIVSTCKFVRNVPVPFAFVKMDTIPQAIAAMKHLNGSIVEGKQLLCKFADSDAAEDAPINNLFVKGCPMNWNEETLRTFFQSFGAVVSVKVLPLTDGAVSQNCLVRMSTVQEATQAIKLGHAVTPAGQSIPLSIKYADTPETKLRRAMKGTGKAPNARYSPYPGGHMHSQYTSEYGAQGFSGGQMYSAQPAPSNGAAGYAAATQIAPMGQQAPWYPPPTEQSDHYRNPMSAPQVDSHFMSPAAPANPLGNGPATVCVTGLPTTAEELAIYRRFAPFGAVLHVNVSPDTAAAGYNLAYITYRPACVVLG
jgi:hypothetical protein